MAPIRTVVSVFGIRQYCVSLPASKRNQLQGLAHVILVTCTYIHAAFQLLLSAAAYTVLFVWNLLACLRHAPVYIPFPGRLAAG